MKEVIGKGKNLDEATQNALIELRASREEVEVEPMDTGTSGFLGFGRKPALVRVSLRQDNKIRTNVFLRTILKYMKIDTSIEIKEDDDNLIIVLGEEASTLIGHRGQTLDALQYLIARYLNEDKEDWKKVVVDIDNYRDKREDNLRSMALRMAEQVSRSKRDVRTEPLTAPERRIIHMTLKENSNVTTFSIGDGVKKRVVIASTDKEASRRGPRRGGAAGNRRRGSNSRGGGRGFSGEHSQGQGGGQRNRRPRQGSDRGRGQRRKAPQQQTDSGSS